MHRAHVTVRSAAQFRCVQCVGAEIPHERFSKKGQTHPQNIKAPRPRRDALKRYHDSKTSLVREDFRFLPATKRDTAPAPASAYPTDAPWTPASDAQSPCPSAPEPRTPAASCSS